LTSTNTQIKDEIDGVIQDIISNLPPNPLLHKEGESTTQRLIYNFGTILKSEIVLRGDACRRGNLQAFSGERQGNFKISKY
jgi:hypothetical protein